jgi:hypothetical protein
MTIQIYSIGNVKKDLMNVGRMFESSDTLGGINSRHINALEQKMTTKTGRQSVFVNSCTNGIYLALKKMDLRGRYVIMPPITFFGIASAIVKAGGIPVYKRVLDLFEAEGIKTLFGIPDPNFVHLCLEAEARGWTVVSPHHEAAAESIRYRGRRRRRLCRRAYGG